MTPLCEPLSVLPLSAVAGTEQQTEGTHAHGLDDSVTLCLVPRGDRLPASKTCL